MNLWHNFWGHLHTILRHKKMVRRNCFRAGLYWQGISHDWSKYHPIEFWNGVKYYQAGKRSPNHAEKEDKSYTSAWLHHKGRNRHHYEYWIDIPVDSTQGQQGMCMPDRYIVEMFCDRMAASKNYNAQNYDDSFPLAYYEKNKGHYLMHPHTKELLEKLLHMLAEEGEDKTFAYIRTKLDLKHSPKW